MDAVACKNEKTRNFAIVSWKDAGVVERVALEMR